MELAALAVALSTAFVALVLTPLVRRIATKLNFVDKPGERKIHERNIAYGGGIAVALAMGITLLIALPWVQGMEINKAKDDLTPPEFLILGLGGLGALLLGLYDDKFKLSPGTKLAAQFVLAIAAVAGGVRITAFIGDGLPMQAVTVLWIVLITNSFNLLDNMDGLCSGTAAISSGVLALVAMDGRQWALMLALAALCGACLGFLRYNRSPATIFLGDGGSLCIGFLMACATAMVTYFRKQYPSHLGVGIPILVLAIPLYDTCTVILIRLKEKRPIMRGDNSHFSHRLVDLGMSRRQAVATIHLACLAIALPATVLGQLTEARGFLIIGQAILVLTIVALLERAGRARALARDGQAAPGALDLPANSSTPKAEDPALAATAPKENSE